MIITLDKVQAKLLVLALSGTPLVSAEKRELISVVQQLEKELKEVQ